LAFTDHKNITQHAEYINKQDVHAQDLRWLALRYNPEPINSKLMQLNNQNINSHSTNLPSIVTPNQNNIINPYTNSRNKPNIIDQNINSHGTKLPSIMTPNRKNIINPYTKSRNKPNINKTSKISFLPKCLEYTMTEEYKNFRELQYRTENIKSNLFFKNPKTAEKRFNILEEEFTYATNPENGRIFKSNKLNNENEASSDNKISSSVKNIINILYLLANKECSVENAQKLLNN